MPLQTLQLHEEFPRRKDSTPFLGKGLNGRVGAHCATPVQYVPPFNSQNKSLGRMAIFPPLYRRQSRGPGVVNELPDRLATKGSALRRPDLEANPASIIALPGRCCAGTGGLPSALPAPFTPSSSTPSFPSFPFEDKTVTSRRRS